MRPNYSFGWMVALAATLTSCAPSGTQYPDFHVESLYFEPIGQGFYASLADTTELLLRHPEDWEAFLPKLQPRRDFVAVDFEQTMVLVVALPAPSGGYSIAFETVEKIGDEIVATYLLSKPGSDCMTVSSLTQPFEAIAVRRVEGPVRFVRTIELVPCST